MTKYAQPCPDYLLVERQHSESNTERQGEIERQELLQERRVVTEAQAPASQPSGQQLSTGASVVGGDIKLEVVLPLYTSVLFCPTPKVIPNCGSDCSLEWKRLCSVFPHPSFERSVGSGTCATVPQQD